MSGITYIHEYIFCYHPPHIHTHTYADLHKLFEMCRRPVLFLYNANFPQKNTKTMWLVEHNFRRFDRKNRLQSDVLCRSIQLSIVKREPFLPESLCVAYILSSKPHTYTHTQIWRETGEKECLRGICKWTCAHCKIGGKKMTIWNTTLVFFEMMNEIFKRSRCFFHSWEMNPWMRHEGRSRPVRHSDDNIVRSILFERF